MILLPWLRYLDFDFTFLNYIIYRMHTQLCKTLQISYKKLWTIRNTLLTNCLTNLSLILFWKAKQLNLSSYDMMNFVWENLKPGKMLVVKFYLRFGSEITLTLAASFYRIFKNPMFLVLRSIRKVRNIHVLLKMLMIRWLKSMCKFWTFPKTFKHDFYSSQHLKAELRDVSTSISYNRLIDGLRYFLW